MRYRNIIASIGLALLIAGCTNGCTSTSRTTYNTLASVQVATTGAYNGYLDLVVQGKVTTNAVPTVSRDYNLFQTVWSGAVVVARWATNTPASQQVLDAAAVVVTDINKAKGVTP